METKYVTVNIPTAKLKGTDVPQNRKVRRSKSKFSETAFWQIAAIAMVIMFLISIQIGVHNIDRANELSTELMETRVELAELQAEYDQLVATTSKQSETPPHTVLSLSTNDTKLYASEMLSKSKTAPETTVTSVTSSPEPTPSPTPAVPEMFSEVPLDEDLKLYIYEAALEAELKPEIIFALAWNESRFNPDAVSETHDYGMFQINRCNFGTLAEVFGKSKSEIPSLLKDPKFCCDSAIYLLKDILDTYEPENYHQLLMMYNQGATGARRSFSRGYYSSSYSRKVINFAMENYGLTDYNL